MTKHETAVMEQFCRERQEFKDALEESVKLQSHYAELLNTFDGGKRVTFADGAAWIARLKGVA